MYRCACIQTRRMLYRLFKVRLHGTNLNCVVYGCINYVLIKSYITSKCSFVWDTMYNPKWSNKIKIWEQFKVVGKLTKKNNKYILLSTCFPKTFSSLSLSYRLSFSCLSFYILLQVERTKYEFVIYGEMFVFVLF